MTTKYEIINSINKIIADEHQFLSRNDSLRVIKNKLLENNYHILKQALEDQDKNLFDQLVHVVVGGSSWGDLLKTLVMIFTILLLPVRLFYQNYRQKFMNDWDDLLFHSARLFQQYYYYFYPASRHSEKDTLYYEMLKHLLSKPELHPSLLKEFLSKQAISFGAFCHNNLEIVKRIVLNEPLFFEVQNELEEAFFKKASDLINIGGSQQIVDLIYQLISENNYQLHHIAVEKGSVVILEMIYKLVEAMPNKESVLQAIFNKFDDASFLNAVINRQQLSLAMLFRQINSLKSSSCILSNLLSSRHFSCFTYAVQINKEKIEDLKQLDVHQSEEMFRFLLAALENIPNSSHLVRRLLADQQNELIEQNIFSGSEYIFEELIRLSAIIDPSRSLLIPFLRSKNDDYFLLASEYGYTHLLRLMFGLVQQFSDQSLLEDILKSQNWGIFTAAAFYRNHDTFNYLEGLLHSIDNNNNLFKEMLTSNDFLIFKEAVCQKNYDLIDKITSEIEIIQNATALFKDMLSSGSFLGYREAAAFDDEGVMFEKLLKIGLKASDPYGVVDMFQFCNYEIIKILIEKDSAHLINRIRTIIQDMPDGQTYLRDMLTNNEAECFQIAAQNNSVNVLKELAAIEMDDRINTHAMKRALLSGNNQNEHEHSRLEPRRLDFSNV